MKQTLEIKFGPDIRTARHMNVPDPLQYPIEPVQDPADTLGQRSADCCKPRRHDSVEVARKTTLELQAERALPMNPTDELGKQPLRSA